MLWLIIAAITAILALLAAGGWVATRRAVRRLATEAAASGNSRDRRAAENAALSELVWGVVAIGLTAVTGLIVFCDSWNRIPANEIGIVTEFGKQSGTVSEGSHFLAPWAKVDTFSTRVQSSVRTQASNEGDKAAADCVQVRLKDGDGACVDATIRYSVNQDKAVELWRRYGSFDAVRDQLVRSTTNDAFRVVFGALTPEESVAKGNGTLSDATNADLVRRLADSGVTDVSVSVGSIHLDAPVQDRLNAILQAQADVKIAEQKKAKALAEADANRALSDSLNTPGVLTKMCLDAAREAKPTVFPSCFPGTGTGAPGVIVNPGR